MKKNYVKPEIAEYDMMPCEILAGSVQGQADEKIEEDGETITWD